MTDIKRKLYALVQKGESAEVEFKSARGGFPGSFWESYSAFANTNGGTIILGVQEKDGKFLFDGLSEETALKYKKNFWDNAHNRGKVSVCLPHEQDVEVKEINGVKCEPIELLSINVPEEYSSKIIDMVTRRKGEMVTMATQNDRIQMEFNIPSRGIIGLRTNVLTASAGEAIMSHRFLEYQPWKGDIERRTNGSLIAMESGTAYAYAIDKLQDRGRFFIFPQEEVYAGQVVGENAKDNDIVVNVTKSKKLTNMRASGADDKARIVPPVVFSLEEALEYIKADEYVEVPHTPAQNHP